MTIDPLLAEELRNLREQLLQKGSLLKEEKLRTYYETFRERFGPEVLASYDGVRLLEFFHGRGNKESLTYWLEFKNDEEFPAIFGSIAGGSALKFGMYQSSETREWMTGSPQKQIRLSTDDAVQLVRRQRDQLVSASRLVADASQAGSSIDYRALQDRLTDAAPDLHDSAWFHKYIALLFPAVIDDFHAAHYQRFHLVKLLIVPPEGEGRFVCAGHFVAAAEELDMPLNHLTTVLNHRNGAPHAWWRVGTRHGGTGESQWHLMRDGGFASIGWSGLGDLSDITSDSEGKAVLRARLDEAHPKPPPAQGNALRQVFAFVARAAPRDMVLACDGAKVLGVGRIMGDYEHAPGEVFPHRRPVEWLDAGEWKLQPHEGLRTTFVELRKHRENLVEAERRILYSKGAVPPVMTATKAQPLSGIPGRIQEILQRKGQVILYGPPGTGKTYQAQVTIFEMAARQWKQKSWDALSKEEQRHLLDTAITTCTFHPGYGYEDFIEGYRPEERAETLVFVRRDGLFKTLCKRAHDRPDRPFFLLIDEINRGDIPRIFGELITLLEKTRRGEVVHLAQSGDRFSVPPNLYVVGTMNTADRSIALLDAALRRRFGFVELMPDPDVLGDASVVGVPLGPWLAALNKRILQHVGRDARNLQVGHAYLLHDGRPVRDARRFVQILRDDVVPLLEEYCYEDYDALESILGRRLVDRGAQRIVADMFLQERGAELAEALLEVSPDILASTRAVQAEEKPEDEEDASEGEEDEAA